MRPGGPRSPASPHAGGARPPARKRYGQHHLVDAGTLQAILSMAAVRSDDVVLEVGAADGTLTRPLLERAGAVHAFEIDRRFTAALERLAPGGGLQVHVADALRYPLEALDPPPTALVANLAYNIAIPVIAETIARLPSLERWAVMVQRELAERLFATPRTKPYAAVSVLVQLACEQTGWRPVSRRVFAPPPRVDSVFLTFARRQGWSREAHREVAKLVRLAFGQRRKMLTTTLAGASFGGHVLARDDVRGALRALGLPGTARPEELAPPDFVALAGALRGEA